MRYSIEIEKKKKEITLFLPAPKNKVFSISQLHKYIKFILSCTWKIKTEDKLSIKQMALIHIMLTCYGDFLGYTPEEMKVLFKSLFCAENDIKYFSCSPDSEDAASMETAEKFIDFIGNHAVNNGFNMLVPQGKGEHMQLVPFREITKDIQRYVLSCLRNKTCCVCGAKTENDIMIDLHHSPQLSIPYTLDTGKLTGFMSLCRIHHSEAHTIGLKTFEEKYHLEPVWLNDKLIRQLKKIYPNHFQAFKEYEKSDEK